jgi:hypothetical protein
MLVSDDRKSVSSAGKHAVKQSGERSMSPVQRVFEDDGSDRITAQKAPPSSLLAAFVIDCGCGERVLFGDAASITSDADMEAWRATLTDVAERLALQLVWVGDQTSCARCGTPIAAAC